MFSMPSAGQDIRSFQHVLQGAMEELKQPKRGAGLLFRTYYSNHLDLSRTADRKAHFMIGLNVFLLSLVITRKHMGTFSHTHYLAWPNLVLVLSTVLSIVLAVLATRPAVPKRPPPGDIRPINLFFFGSFCHYPLEEFHKQAQALMLDEAAMYKAMSQDMHFMGISLARKYRLLSYCYQSFFYGILLTCISYAVAFIYHWV